MTGPDHFRKAEELSRKAHEYLGQRDGQESAAVAQIHATSPSLLPLRLGRWLLRAVPGPTLLAPSSRQIVPEAPHFRSVCLGPNGSEDLTNSRRPRLRRRWVMSRPCAVATRPGLCFAPLLASPDDRTQRQPVSLRSARSEVSWSRLWSQDPSRGCRTGRLRIRKPTADPRYVAASLADATAQ